jgi:hypothetical protein
VVVVPDIPEEIPPEAVEAALKAVRQATWNGETYVALLYRTMEAALTAAYPHLEKYPAEYDEWSPDGVTSEAQAKIADLLAENARLTKALGEQTEQVRKWRNRSTEQRQRRRTLLHRLGLGTHEDDQVAVDARVSSLVSQLEAAEKELAIAKRIIMRHLPELVEAVRDEVAALSDAERSEASVDEGKPK